VKTRNILRAAIICEWVFIILQVVSSFMFKDTLPELLQQWLVRKQEACITSFDIMFLFLAIPLLIAYLISSVYLLLLKKWAKWTYLVSLLFMAILVVLDGPDLSNAIESLFAELASICSGIIIALVFFTNVLNNTAEQDCSTLPRKLGK